MKLTRSVSYAVSILLRIHAEGGGPVTAARISRGCRFPPRFLYRVLRRMVDAGLLHGVSGPGGGYSLAREARKITLPDVVMAIEGAERPEPLAVACSKHRGALRAIETMRRQQLTRTLQAMRRLNLAALAQMSGGRKAVTKRGRRK